ncbi:MAG: class I SAM-dependent methyltransferase [Chloroflexi bacterium]|nr:class I SAM-dependent methyltransferase [Chloroflexota bacterium]
MTTDQQQQQKSQMHEQWSTAARTWAEQHDLLAGSSREATLALVDAADLKPGHTVLDLAGGTGEPSMTVAQRVQPGGSVVCTDLTDEMLTAAEQNARKRGLSNMSFRRVDAENIPFDDASFDRVTCRFGIMFCPDSVRALSEVHRVLRPVGRAAFVVWGPAAENPMFQVTNSVLAAHGLVQPPPPGALTPFTFAEPGSLSAKMRDAGFSDVHEEKRDVAWPWPGPPESHIQFMRATQPATQRALDTAPGAVIDELKAAMGKYYDGTHINYGARIYVAWAVK